MFLLLPTTALIVYAFYCFFQVKQNNAEYKRMEKLTLLYKSMLDQCKSIIDTIYVEGKYKDYMLKYKKYGSKPQENGYEEFMDEFEEKLFNTKLKLK